MSAKDLMVARLQNGETIYGHKESGNSMSPLIESREPVDIRPVDRELKVGDIVFVRIGRRYYLHLVSAINNDRVQISNNHGHVNGWTSKANVFGLVTPST